MSETTKDGFTRAASIAELPSTSCHVVHLDGHSIALFEANGRIYAVDNRCPHMGYPLSRGSVSDCILTCHWHHARFDLETGGTFDQWADDVRSFPVEVRGDEIWVDLRPQTDAVEYYRGRLRVGLERNLSLVVGKAVLNLMAAGVEPADPFRTTLEFGTKNRMGGWGQGLTILACMQNVLPFLDAEERPRALYHGLSAVARDTAGAPPRFMIDPLPGADSDPVRLKRWFRQFVEVRDSEGAERCIVTAVRSGADHEQMADMLFSAATDHRYIQIGHVLDFTNKAFEALDIAGWEYAETVLSSLTIGYANAPRMEEANEWRHPVDLVRIVERSFDRLGQEDYDRLDLSDGDSMRRDLMPVLLGDDPQASADALTELLLNGAPPESVAGAVAYAAVLRIARFHTNNEFGDWDRALHTFTFANAVHQGLRRVQSRELVRGIYDAAMSIYLDRFLNIPPARLPEPDGRAWTAAAFDEALSEMLNRQQQVNEAGALVASALNGGIGADRVMAALGRALLREDRDFHTIQTVEAAFRQFTLLEGTPEGPLVLVAAARYLAAHSPTVRAQGQTYEIARRLQRGENLFD